MARNLKLNIGNEQLATLLEKGLRSKSVAAPAPKKPPIPPPLTKGLRVRRKKELQAAPPSPTASVAAVPPPEQPPLVPPPAEAPMPPAAEAPSKKRSFALFQDYREVRGKPRPSLREARSPLHDRRGLRSDEKRRRRKKPLQGEVEAKTEPERPQQLKIRLPLTVKELAAEMKLKASQLIAQLLERSLLLTLNDSLEDATVVQRLGEAFDCQITIDRSADKHLQLEEETIGEELLHTQPAQLRSRSPVIAFMGHVDHGKTSLIDAIRRSNRAEKEIGAITQHIGAFRVTTSAGLLTILDTPGHEAFVSMRARGAKVTDMIILVIAGDEGIQEQTVETISHARAANIPIVVALNKCDKSGFAAETVYRQLADHQLLPEAWGGDVITANCSARTGEGITELLELIALQSQVLELKSNPAARARGTVLESALHKGLGVLATLLIQIGTLHPGDAMLIGQHWGRVKTMHDEHGTACTAAEPSIPVKVTGISGLPAAGDEFIVVSSEKEAKELADRRSQQQKAERLRPSRPAQHLGEEQQKVFHIILRADAQGSLEALQHGLQNIRSPKIALNIVSSAVSEISQSDIALAQATGAMILGLHTRVESHAEQSIKQQESIISLHEIIFHAIEEVKQRMRDQLPLISYQEEQGKAVVKALFTASHLGVIAGCQVVEGKIHRSHQVRLLRDQQSIWEGKIASLRQQKEDVKEINKGYECGILLKDYHQVEVGDIVQAYTLHYRPQQL